MNSRFPRFNRRGQIASGGGTIWIGDRHVADGWEPCPWSDTEWFFKGNDDRPYVIPANGGSPRPVEDAGISYDRLSAGHQTWKGTDPSKGIIDVWVGRNGKRAWIVEHNGHNDDHSVFYESELIGRGSYHHVRTEDNLLVVTRKTPRIAGTGEICGWMPGGSLRSLQVFTHSFEWMPVPFMTDDGPWVGFITNRDIRLHPWLGRSGYILATGEDKNREWDAIWLDGQIRVVWENGGRARGYTTIPLTLARTDVSAPWGATPPPPPKKDRTMDIPRPIYDTWKAVADKFHALHKGSDNDRREATRRGVATIRAVHTGTGPLDGSRWVCKSEHNTGWNAQSKDAPGFVPEGNVEHGRLTRMHMFDMIDGTSRLTNRFPVRSKNFEEGNEEAYVLIPEAKNWLEEDGEPEPEPLPIHAYDGGDNDTGECDFILPDGKKCNRPPTDPLHKKVVDPPPSDDWRAAVAALDGRMRQLALDVTADAGQITDLTRRLTALEQAGGVSEQQLRAAVESALTHLQVEVDIIPAGPKIGFFGTSLDLNHDHGVDVRVLYRGKVVTTRQVAPKTAPRDITVPMPDALKSRHE